MPSFAVSPRFDVAIIGGGASGVLTAVHLLRRCQSQREKLPLSLVLVDDSDHLCRGAAYSTSCPEHLLNVPAKGMSAFPDKKDHFVRWLRQNEFDASPETFAPRMVYGDYIEDVLRDTQRALPDHIQFTLKHDRAVNMEVEPGGVHVELASGGDFDAAAVVLALGNFAPEQSAFTSFLNLPCAGYHDNPWVAETLASVRSEHDVLLIGTGLTMIDVALQLRASGHKGRMVAVSRHGFLPQFHFKDDRMKDDSATSHLPQSLPSNLREAFSAFRAAARAADKERSGNWRFVMNELRNITPNTWKQFAVAEKRRFLRHVRQLWEIHRHRMAPEIHNKLTALQESGALRVVAGRIAGIRQYEDNFDVAISRRSGGAEQVTAQQIVNCTGPQTDLRRVRHPLIVGLLSSGTMTADDLGLSARVDDAGALIGRDGVASQYLFSIGSLRKGSIWETTAVPELREQAKQLSELILQKLRVESRPAMVERVPGATGSIG